MMPNMAEFTQFGQYLTLFEDYLLRAKCANNLKQSPHKSVTSTSVNTKPKKVGQSFMANNNFKKKTTVKQLHFSTHWRVLLFWGFLKNYLSQFLKSASLTCSNDRSPTLAILFTISSKMPIFTETVVQLLTE